MGTKGGRGDGTFVDETCSQVTDFYRDLVQGLRPPQPKAPQLSEEATVAEPSEPEQSEKAARREQDMSLRSIAEMFGQTSY
jgi:hypothetical protein